MRTPPTSAAASCASGAPELLRVIDAVGDIDAAAGVASFRAGTDGLDAPGPARPTAPPPPCATSGTSSLPDAVPNSIVLAPPHGVIITGSNMSGKSTFLRTVGTTMVMAQTINTCLASRYEAPPFMVRSCIGRNDDILAGKSYYIVEVESVLGLVRASETTGRAPVSVRRAVPRNERGRADCRG